MLKERSLTLLRRRMSVATYRGVQYDTDTPKTEYRSWWNGIHHDASRRLTYRGLDYRPCQTGDCIDCYNTNVGGFHV